MSVASEAELQRTIGRLESEVSTLRGEVTAIKQQLGDIHGVVMRAQGSWKALVGTAAFSAAVTGFAIKVMSAVGVLK
jgi:hypothetical protein